MCPPTIVLSHQREMRKLALCNPHVVVAFAMRQASTTEAGQEQAMTDARGLRGIAMPRDKNDSGPGLPRELPKRQKGVVSFEATIVSRFPKTLR